MYGCALLSGILCSYVTKEFVHHLSIINQIIIGIQGYVIDIFYDDSDIWYIYGGGVTTARNLMFMLQ